VTDCASVCSSDSDELGEGDGSAAMALMQVKPISNAQRTRVPFIINDDINALRRNAGSRISGQKSDLDTKIDPVAWSDAISNGMNWVFLGVAIALFITFLILRVVLAIPLGVLNTLWMLAIVFVILWGAQRFA
jgi:hypothetical protein